METTVTEEAVLNKLDNVIDPCSNGIGIQHSLLDMGMVDEIEIFERKVTVHIHLTTPMCKMIPYFVDEVEREVGELPGVNDVSLKTDGGFQWKPDMMDEDAYRERMDQIQ
jgi:metal-sulfur cluster biosynthetic enzyme